MPNITVLKERKILIFQFSSWYFTETYLTHSRIHSINQIFMKHCFKNHYLKYAELTVLPLIFRLNPLTEFLQCRWRKDEYHIAFLNYRNCSKTQIFLLKTMIGLVSVFLHFKWAKRNFLSTFGASLFLFREETFL